MNSKERFLRIMSFGKPDRCMYWEMGYWNETIGRWRDEGLTLQDPVDQTLYPGTGIRGEAAPHDIFSRVMPRDTDVHNRLRLDPGFICLPVNSGPEPRFEGITFEETEDYRVFQDDFGIKKKINKKGASIPQFIDWPVKNRKDFEDLISERFIPGHASRLPENWEELTGWYNESDQPLTIDGYPYGFYGFLRILLGEELLLTSFYDNPGLLKEMLSFFADFWIGLWDEVLKKVRVDCAHFWEDMAYKNGPLISPAMFRQFLSPVYKRITSFLRDWGVNIILVDTDGNMDELIPLFLECGVTGIWPVEIQAGNDLVEIGRKYPRLHILGGLNKLKIALGPQAIEEELTKNLPPMLERGGYIPHLDHFAHPDISWDDFRYYRKLLRKIAESNLI